MRVKRVKHHIKAHHTTYNRCGRLVDHEMIPDGEAWLKLGGDKGGGSFKMSFQLANVARPNSVENTFVFAAFNASDTPANLHVALQRYRDQVSHLQEVQLRYY